MRVGIAGTFGPLHDGHRALLREALEEGDEEVVVGITSDEFAAESRRDDPRPIPSYDERKRKVVDALGALDEWNREAEIRTVTDEYGFADEDPSLDALVVSPEIDGEITRINRRRAERGMAPLDPIVVPYVLAEDGRRISSTRIVRGEIDEHGNLLE